MSNQNVEIERKFTIRKLPCNLEQYPYHVIEQGYLSVNPVVRVRRQDDDYYLTYKGSGMMERAEYNLPLNAAAYEHLKEKADGNIISKKRYLIPCTNPAFRDGFVLKETPFLTIELDVFKEPFAPLIMAEVEFPSAEMANAFLMPDWFLDDVTNDPAYHNSNMSLRPLKNDQAQ